MNYLRSLIKLLDHPNNRGHIIKTCARILWWKANQLLFHLPAVVELLPNTSIVCEPDSSYGSYVVYAGYPEYEEMSFFEKYLRPSDVVVDVGANIGAWSLIAAKKARRGKVYAFEPTSTISELERNARLNNFTNIACVKKVVSNKNGFEYFTTTSASEVSHISTSQKRSKTAQKLKAISLDVYFQRKRGIHIDVLKIDVEGAEIKVLEGCQNLFKKKKVSLIIFEYGKKASAYGVSFSELYAYLERNSFTLFQFKDSSLRKINSNFVSNNTTNVVAALNNSKVMRRIEPFL